MLSEPKYINMSSISSQPEVIIGVTGDISENSVGKEASFNIQADDKTIKMIMLYIENKGDGKWYVIGKQIGGLATYVATFNIFNQKGLLKTFH